MALTRAVAATLQARAARDAAFRGALLREIRRALRRGDRRTARALRGVTAAGKTTSSPP